MNIFKRPKQAFIPVNQPTNFPRFFLIPETTTLRNTKPAINDFVYRTLQRPVTILESIKKIPRETYIQRFIRRENEKFMQIVNDAWTGIKRVGRAIVRWLVWRVMMPLSVGCALWIPIVNPAELPF